MSTHTLSTAPLPQRIRTTPAASDASAPTSAFAALAAWWRRRVAARQALKADRELAGLSAHVLRDIGACDAAPSRADAHAAYSAIDLEMRA